MKWGEVEERLMGYNVKLGHVGEPINENLLPLDPCPTKVLHKNHS